MAIVNKSTTIPVSDIMYIPVYYMTSSTGARNIISSWSNNPSYYSYYRDISTSLNISDIRINGLPTGYFRLNYDFNLSFSRCTVKVYDLADLSLRLYWTDVNYQTKSLDAQDIRDFIDQGGKIYYYNTSKELSTSNFIDITTTLVIPTGYTYNIILYHPSFTNYLDVSSSSLCQLYGDIIYMKPVISEPVTFPSDLDSINDMSEGGTLNLYNSASSPLGNSTNHYMTFHDSLESAFTESGKTLDELWDLHQDSNYSYLKNKTFYISFIGSYIEELMGGIIYDETHESEVRIEVDYEINIDHISYTSDSSEVVMPEMINNITIGSTNLANLISSTNQVLPAGIVIPIRTDQGIFPNPTITNVGAVYIGNQLIYGINPSYWQTTTVTVNNGGLVPGYGQLNASYEVKGYVLSYFVEGEHIVDTDIGEFDFSNGTTKIYYTYGAVNTDDTASCTITYTSIIPIAYPDIPDPLPSENINLPSQLYVYINPNVISGMWKVADGVSAAVGYTLYVYKKDDGSAGLDVIDQNGTTPWSYALTLMTGSTSTYTLSVTGDILGMPVCPDHESNNAYLIEG